MNTLARITNTFRNSPIDLLVPALITAGFGCAFVSALLAMAAV